MWLGELIAQQRKSRWGLLSPWPKSKHCYTAACPLALQAAAIDFNHTSWDLYFYIWLSSNLQALSQYSHYVFWLHARQWNNKQSTFMAAQCSGWSILSATVQQSTHLLHNNRCWPVMHLLGAKKRLCSLLIASRAYRVDLGGMLELFRFLSGYSMLKSCISYLDCHIHYFGTEEALWLLRSCVYYI